MLPTQRTAPGLGAANHLVTPHMLGVGQPPNFEHDPSQDLLRKSLNEVSTKGIGYSLLRGLGNVIRDYNSEESSQVLGGTWIEAMEPDL